MEKYEIIVISIILAAILSAFILLWSRVSALRDELTENKYIIAERKPDGSVVIKDSKGKTIFEL